MQLVADDGHRAEVRLESGQANVAVNTLRPNSLVLIDMPDGQTQILQRGLYTFDVLSQTVRVFNGEADAFPGANTDTAEKPVKVKEGHEVVLSDPHVRATGFDRAEAESDLLPWTGPQETQAAMASGAVASHAGYATAAYYGDGPGPYAFGVGYPYYGWGYPYGFYGYPYGFYGYPFGFGLGIGYYGGLYGRGFGYGHGYGYRGGFAGRGFAGGGFHGGGFGGGRR